MNRKLRIAYLIDTIVTDKGGTEKQLLNIVPRLDRNLFEITIVCLYQSAWMLQKQFPCEVISLGYRGFMKLNFSQVMWRYLQILKKRQFDVVQTFFEDAFFVGYIGNILTKNKHTFIMSRRDLGLGSDEPAYHRVYKKIKPIILRSIDGIVTNAYAIKDDIIKHENVPPNKITVIGNGIELPGPPAEQPSLFREYRADLWIGITANMKPVKRIDLLLQGLAQLQKSGYLKIIRAVVLGDDRLKMEMQRLANELGIANRVHFMGSVENIWDYLHHLDIGILTSDKEGLSNAILEYMACRLPVVVTAVGGNCELVDETNGICIPAGDASALAGALQMLSESPELRSRLGARSFEKVSKSYTWDLVIPRWNRYYQAIAAIR